MNYAGKFDAKLPADGLGPHFDGHAHVETITRHATHAPSDAIIVPDTQLLFNGDFKRSGVDLILSRDDHELILQDYFKGEKRAPLSSPDGAHLTGDIVSALTGHTEYAQADGSAGAGHVIGHVTKLTGTATAIRNGVSIILNQGDNVEKGDVVQSGSDSTVGITFIDGTVFGLSSNARMVLNEMVYDPNGSNNSSLISLVAGTISFVAGDTAKHGDMKIDTPVATMGIRGTAVLVEIDFSIPGQGGSPDAKFQVLVEPDGTTGSYILFDKNTLTPIATVNQAGQQINISNGLVSITNSPLSPDAQKLVIDVFAQKFSDLNTKSFDHFTDSIVPQALQPFVLADGASAAPVVVFAITPDKSSASLSNGPGYTSFHIDLAPDVVAFGNAFTVHSGTAHSSVVDTVSGTIRFADVNPGDLPTVKAKFDSFTLQDAQHNDIKATLTTQQLAEIAAVEAQLVVVPSPGNNNIGSATWTYSVADKAFGFLTAGETLTLTYMAEVDTNFPAYNTEVFKPFTITITTPNVVDWIHPTGGLWSTASNWETGAVPTASDDVAIPDEQSAPGTYAVTIATAAVASSVTLNAYGMSGTQLINNSTLTIGDALIIQNDGVLDNSGTISIGNQMELLDQSSLQNSGLIALGGGDFQDQSTVTNTGTGTIEVSGGTLNVLVDIANSGLLTIDPTATLTLNGAAITGGTLTNDGIIDLVSAAALQGGSLGNSGQVDVSGSGNALDGETVSNTGAIDVTGVLTLDLGTTITGGTLTNSGTVKIEAASGATLDGVNVENGSGVIQVDNALSPDVITLVVDDGTTITGGTVTIGPVGIFEVATTLGATLDGVSMGNSGVVQVDAGSRLNLDGTIITGGSVTDGGTIEVTGDSAINSAAVNGGQVTVDAGQTLTLDGTTVTGTAITDSGTVKVDAGQTLNLSGVVLSGGAIDDLGVLDITGDSSISSDALSNTQLTVDAGQTLTLNGTTVTGGTVTDNGMIHVTGDSAINDAALNGGEITVDDGKTLTLDSTTVTGTVITDTGMVKVDAGMTRKLSGVALSGGEIINLGIIEITGDSSISYSALSNTQLTIDITTTLTLNGTTVTGGTVTDNGTILITGDSAINGAAVDGGQVTVDAGKTLTLDATTVTGTTITDSGTVKVDLGKTLNLGGVALTGGAISNLGILDITDDSSISSDALSNTQLTVGAGQTLTLNGTTVTGGTVTDNGIILITGDSAINSAAVDGGQVTVDAGQTLTLDSTTVTGTTVADSGTVKVDLGKTLNLSGVALSGGAITNLGTIDITGDSSIGSDAMSNTQLTVDAGKTLALNGTTVTGGIVTDNGTIEIAGDSSINSVAVNGGQVTVDIGQTLTLDGTTVTGTAITDAGTVKVDLGQTLNLSEVALSGGAITNLGTIDITGDSSISSDALSNNQLTVDAGQTLTLNTATVTGGTVTDQAGGTIDLTGGGVVKSGSLGNAGQINVTGLGNALDGETVTSNNALEVMAGGALLIDQGSTVANTGTVTVDGTGTLTLNTATITGGTVTDKAGGTIDLTGGGVVKSGSLGNAGQINVTGLGNALDGETVTGNNALEVMAGGALLIDQGSTVANTGTVTVDGTGTLTLNTATVTGGTVTDKAGGTIDLTGGGVVKSGSLGNAGQINVTGLGNALDGETVTSNNALEVMAGGALLIDQGSTVANTGTVTVDGTGTLTLNTATVTGGTVTDKAGGTIDLTGGGVVKSGSLGNAGQINVTGLGNALDGETVTSNNALEVMAGGALLIDQGSTVANTGTVTVDGTGTLTLNTATVTGGTVTDKAGGTIDLTGGGVVKSGSLGNAGQINVTGLGNALDGETVTSNNALEVMAGGALLIDQGSTVANTGTVTVDGTGTLTLNTATVTGGTVTDKAGGTIDLTGGGVVKSGSLGNAGQINVTGLGNALDGETVTSNNALEVMAGGALLIDQGSTVANTGTVTVDGTGTLTLNTATITGGTVTDKAGGTIDLTGGGVVKSGSLGNAGQINVTGLGNALDGETVTSNNALEVMAGGALLIDQGSTVANTGTVTVDGTGTLTLNTATVTGGTVTDKAGGTIDLTGGGVVKSGSLGNAGQINVTGLGNALDGETVTSNNALEVMAGGALLIDQGSTVANTGTVTVDGTGTLTLNTATVTGGTVTDKAGGTIDLTGGGVVKSGSLGNAGQINVTGLGNALDGETVTSNNALEVMAGGALLIDQGSTVANTGTVTVDGTGTLTLNTATVTGGTVTDKAGGTIDLTGGGVVKSGSLGNAGQINVTGLGNALDGETVTSNNALEVMAGGALLIDQGSTVANTGTVTVDGTGTLTLNTATITGGTVTDKAGGTIDLTGGGVVKSGSLGNAGQINVTGLGNALDGETVTSNNALEVMAGGALLIDQGSTVANTGTVTVDGTGTLTLNTATVTGGTVTDKAGGTIDLTGGGVVKSGSLGNAGQINVTGLGNALDGETVTSNNALEVMAGGALLIDQGSTVANTGTVTVDGTGTLTLNTATVTGGTVTDKAGGTIDLTGGGVVKSGSLGNAGQINVTGLGNALDGETVTSNNALEVMAGGALLIDQGSTVANTGTVTVDGTGTLTLNTATVTGGTVTDKAGGTIDLTGGGVVKSGSLGNAGQINVTGLGNALDGETVTSNNALEVMAGGALLIDQGSTVANTGTVTVDGTGTLTLNTATVTGGTVTDKAGGTIDLTGGGVVKSGSLGNAGQINVTGLGNALDGETVTSNNALEVMAGGALLIDQGSTVANTGTVTVDGTGTLTLNTATVTGGTVTDKAGGTIDLTGGGVVKSGSLGNAGQINVTGLGNALDGETVTSNNALEVMAGGALLIDQGSTVANTGTVTVDGTGTLTLNTATITGGTVTDKAGGTIDLTGGGVVKSGSLGNAGQINVTGLGNALDGETVTSNNALEVMAGGALLIDQGSTVANTGTVTVDGTGTLTLNTATITGGTVTDNGTIYAIATVGIAGNIGGTGAIDINNNAQIEIGGSVASTDTVFFAGNQGELILDHAKQFSGLITGSSLGTQLTSNDQIDLRDLSFINGLMSATASYNSTANISTVVFSDGTHANDITLQLSGNYTNDSWQFFNDGSGGTLVELATVDHWLNASGGTWNVAGNWSAGVPTSVTNVAIDVPGTYTVTSTANVDINSLVVQAGATLLTDPGTLFTVEGSVLNNGQMNAGPFSQNFISTIDIKGNVSGTGLFLISDKAVLEFGGSVSAGETVEFTAGHGTLILDDSAQFRGLIESSANGTPLSTGNLIDLGDLSFTSSMTSSVDYNKTTNISSVDFSNGSTTINLLFFGNDSHWTLTSDGHGGTTAVDPPVAATIDSGMMLDIASASAESVSFTNGTGTTGNLVLDDSKDFIGVITGFAGDGTLANSDSIDLKDVAFSNLTTETYTENSGGTGGTLSLSDGTQSTNVNFSGNFVLQNFNFSNDGSGGTLLIDPPVTSAESRGAGTTTIDGKGILDFETPTTTNVVFASGAAGTLKLGDSFHFNGTITGFGASDTIDLANVGSAAASISYHANAAGTGGTLAVSNGAQVVELSLVGHYTPDNFSIVPDHATGTLVTLVPHDLIV